MKNNIENIEQKGAFESQPELHDSARELNAQNVEVKQLVEPETRRVFNWLDLIFVIFCFALSQGLGGFIAMMLGVELPNELMRSSFETEVVEAVGAIQARFVAISYLISMVICFVLLGIYSRIRGWRDLISLRSLGWASPFRLLCGYIFMWIVSISLEPLTAILPGDQSAMGNGGWLLLSAVALAPVFEEVVFRGYIAGGLRRSYGGIVAWFVSALIFGVAHIIPSVVVTAFFSGLVLSFYYLRYRSLVLVVVLHAMNNATACFLMAIGQKDTSLRDILGGGDLYWAVYGGCVLFSLIIFLRMIKQLSHLKSDNSEPKK